MRLRTTPEQFDVVEGSPAEIDLMVKKSDLAFPVKGKQGNSVFVLVQTRWILLLKEKSVESHQDESIESEEAQNPVSVRRLQE